MQSHINLSRIVRAAGCCGIQRIIACGNASLDRRIARDGADIVTLEIRRSLEPRLRELKSEGYRLAGLEQATGSQDLYQYVFAKKSILVVGHERSGISETVLDLVDDVIEIPVYGLPFSYNVATATAMALYEYCRQFPQG